MRSVIVTASAGYCRHCAGSGLAIADPAQLPAPHCTVFAFRMVICPGKVIHAMRYVQEQLLGGVPSRPLRRGAKRLVHVHEKLSVEARLLRWDGIIRLGHDVRGARNAHYRAMHLVGSRVTDQMHNDLMPFRIADALPRPVRKIRGGRRHRSPLQANRGRQSAFYDNSHLIPSHRFTRSSASCLSFGTLALPFSASAQL